MNKILNKEYLLKSIKEIPSLFFSSFLVITIIDYVSSTPKSKNEFISNLFVITISVYFSQFFFVPMFDNSVKYILKIFRK